MSNKQKIFHFKLISRLLMARYGRFPPRLKDIFQNNRLIYIKNHTVLSAYPVIITIRTVFSKPKKSWLSRIFLSKERAVIELCKEIIVLQHPAATLLSFFFICDSYWSVYFYANFSAS